MRDDAAAHEAGPLGDPLGRRVVRVRGEDERAEPVRASRAQSATAWSARVATPRPRAAGASQ
jgi:hypothetical protein